MALKEQNKLSDKDQEELNAIQLRLMELGKEIEAMPEETKEEANTKGEESTAYVVPKGKEKQTILKIARGKKFDPETGEREDKAYEQTFTDSEALIFLETLDRSGYVIEEVLNDPKGIVERWQKEQEELEKQEKNTNN